jgi:hypothetical protein
MVDTLKIAEDPQGGEDGFPPARARKLARAIAEASDDKRLRDLEVKVNVQAIQTGLMLAAMVALFWQLLALRGEVSAGLARLDERLAGFQRATEQRCDAFERRPTPS